MTGVLVVLPAALDSNGDADSAAHAMRFGLDVPVSGAYADLRLLSDLAAEAESAGWDGVFLQDVLHSADPVADPWVALAAVALRTRRVQLGSSSPR